MKMFRLMSEGFPGIPSEIPWKIVEGFEGAAIRNHDQSLARLNERGGLSPTELLAMLENRKWHKMTPDQVREKLIPILKAHDREQSVIKILTEALNEISNRRGFDGQSGAELRIFARDALARADAAGKSSK